MLKYIVFTSRDQYFALDITKVERIIEYQAPNQIPESFDYLLGVIQYNEKILPVIDLNKRLYDVDSSLDKENKIIVVIWKEKYIGLVVDDILGIQAFDDEQFEQTDMNTQVSKEYVKGFIKTKENITIVLEIDSIFDENEEEQILLTTGNKLSSMEV